jgi:uncharacterized membrane protein
MDLFALILVEWISVILRWVHVLAAVAWLGAGFWVRRLALRSEQLIGQPAELEVWETHSLSFWRVQKITRPTPEQIDRLVWSFVQIRWLFATGVLLFALIYYRQPQLTLVDPSWPMSSAAAIALSIAGFIGAPLVNEVVNRLDLRSDRLYYGLCLAHLVGWAALYSTLFSPRGAVIQIGAMLATTVVANILGFLMPAMRRAAEDVRAGRPQDPSKQVQWNRRGKHTLILPAVVFFMLASHFSGVIADGYVFPTILLVVAASIIGRLILEETHRNGGITPVRLMWVSSVLAIATLVPMWLLSGWQANARLSTGQAAAHGEVERIVGQRCAACHSERPSFPDMASAPKGVVLTAETLERYAPQIRLMVGNGSMPPGNATEMTDAERAVLLDWALQQHH